MIVSGRYLPGDRLPPERALAATLGVSRPALREGLRRLTSEGVLEVRRGSGTYVGQVDLPALFAVRQRLEPLAAGLAAAMATDEERAQLGEMLVPLRAADTPGEFGDLDLALHVRITQLSGNDILISLIESLTFLSRLSRRVTAPSEIVRRDALADMERIVAAILAADGPAAERAMARHLRRVQKDAHVEAPE